MQRKIEFRGKSNSNKWVNGYYYANPINCFILPFNWEISERLDAKIIDRKTLGQFTGLRDKNGVKIYEGDILKIKETPFQIGGLHQVIFYEDRYLTYSILYNDIDQANKHPLAYQIEYANAHVIGNIHDNPELLNK